MTKSSASKGKVIRRSVVGRGLPHDSAMRHVRGEAIYIDDMPDTVGTLHIAPILSPIAHGILHNIDVSKALSMPGVVDWLSASDITGENDVAPIASGEPLLVEKRLEHQGQFIGAIIAETLDQAIMAADRVKLDFTQKKPCLSVRDAYKRGLRTLPDQHLRRGDVQKIFKSSDYDIFEGTIKMGGQDHFYLEGQVAYAIPREDGGLVVWSSTQHPTEAQLHVSKVLGLPATSIEVCVRRMGGGFGGKESQASIIASIASLASIKTGCPCRFRLRRHSDMASTGKRHGYEIDWKIAVSTKGRTKGRIGALRILALSNTGHVADLSGPVLTRALTHIDNCYYIPNADFLGVCCKTNTVSNTAFRGFGAPQGMLAMESIIDEVSHYLGISPNEMRTINYYGKGRDTTPYGQRVTDSRIPNVVDRVLQKSNYASRRASIDRFNAKSPILKRGLSLMPVKFGISFNLPTLNQAGSLIHVYKDGSIHLNHGGTEMGQGLFIKVAQVVSDAFGVSIDTVKITTTTTDKVPNTSATAASSGSDLNGMAALSASLEIRSRMETIAHKVLGGSKSSIRFADGKVYSGSRSMTFSSLALQCWFERVSLSSTGFYKTPKIHWDSEKLEGHPYYYYTYGAAVCEVVIDTLTGENRCLQADIVQDCGDSLNPHIDLGQIEGAFVQGMGWLTCEELWWDSAGRLCTVGPSTYKIPGSRDVPEKFSVEILDGAPNAEPTIFRSKAIGEPPLMLATGVWLSIRDAISSISDTERPVHLDAPATPERILSAIDAVRSK